MNDDMYSPIYFIVFVYEMILPSKTSDDINVNKYACYDSNKYQQ